MGGAAPIKNCSWATPRASAAVSWCIGIPRHGSTHGEAEIGRGTELSQNTASSESGAQKICGLGLSRLEHVGILGLGFWIQKGEHLRPLNPKAQTCQALALPWLLPLWETLGRAANRAAGDDGLPLPIQLACGCSK